MLKLVFIIPLCLTAILADEPQHWYPANYAEIEAKCLEQFPISAESMADIRNLKHTDSPTIRSLFFCRGTGKNVYLPEVGFDAERIVYDMQQTYKTNCDVGLVRDCIENNQESDSEDELYFSIMKCIFDSASEECDSIV